MAVPKQRKTKSRQGNQRAHKKLSGALFVACKKCGAVTKPHVMCENCGTYKGREVVDVLVKLQKRERKQKEKELKAQEKEAKPLSVEELSKK